MYNEKNDAKGISGRSALDKLPPQPVCDAPIQTDFRVAPERYSA